MFLHLTQSSHVLDGHPHFAPPCSGSKPLSGVM
jgi:hypothetical protein